MSVAAARETSPQDYRAVWDQYKGRFLRVYKGVDEETLLGLFISPATSPFDGPARVETKVLGGEPDSSGRDSFVRTVWAVL